MECDNFEQKVGDESKSDDGQENEAAYHDAYVIVHSRSYELEMSSSDDESLECKPDLDSLGQFEGKKKVELRKQKLDSNEDDDDKTMVSKPEVVTTNHFRSVKAILPKKDSPWILTKESGWLTSSSPDQHSERGEMEMTTKKKLVFLEPRNAFK